ncbi:MAG: hypothetical protein PHR68_03975 [Candidatus Gracilibacteria bacterium]|nr:hypothetical protein [Candidatus Gracilibacteria bacterium]
MLIFIIIMLSIINFFLFRKSIKKENLGISNLKINLAYFFVFIFQIGIILFISFAFINIFFNLILSLLLYFNLIYFVTVQLFQNIENFKDLGTIITIRFLKYEIIFYGIIVSIIGLFYIFFLLFSKIN